MKNINENNGNDCIDNDETNDDNKRNPDFLPKQV